MPVTLPRVLPYLLSLVACVPSLALAAPQFEHWHEGSARAYLDEIGRGTVQAVTMLTESVEYRARSIAADPRIAENLALLDSKALTDLARSAVLSSDLVDVVAIFNADGRLVALNDSDARGNVFESDRLRKLAQTTFDDREIIMGCLRGTSNEEQLEFQATCDFTPVLFDSAGRSIAFSTPVQRDGEVLGVVSVRLRFERLMSRMNADAFLEQGNRIWFVADDGTIFDEAVLRGDALPPIPKSELAEILGAIDWEHSRSFEYERDGQIMSLFGVPRISAIEGGGIHILLEASTGWIDDIARANLDREENLESKFATAGAVALLLALALGIAWITRRRLKHAYQLAERASQSKSSFLAATSHEIRTPMTAILGYAEVLAETGEDAASAELREEAVDAIQHHGKHLLTLIGDVLDLAKVEAGAIVLDPHPIDPRTLAADIQQLLQGTAEEKGLALTVEVADGTPECVLMDATRMRQVLLNLVGNSLKFTESGGVRVRVGCSNFAAGDRLMFEVVDTGIGMTPEASARIFDAYAQAEASTTRRFGGTGLGLSISKQLANLMGGTIECRSTLGKGSTFTVSVQVPFLGGVNAEGLDRVPSALPSQQATAGLPRASLAGVRVLLADDGATNRRLFSLIMERAKIDVTMAEDGQQAVDAWQAADAPFDLVLMDAQMPVLDGTRALEEMRRLGADLPIVVLTADAVSGAREGYLAAGFDDFVTKPITRDDLLAVVARWSVQRAPTSEVAA